MIQVMDAAFDRGRLSGLALLIDGEGFLVNDPKFRVHGNGFMQLDIDEKRRLHVWGHPGIPHQKVWSHIHDHVFSFKSVILKGSIVNVSYTMTDNPKVETKDQTEYKVYTVAREPDTENTILVDTGARSRVFLSSCHRYGPGQRYQEFAGNYHETAPLEPSITMITKNGPTFAQGGAAPHILVPVGKEPDNEFHRDRAASQERLWEIFMEVLYG